MSGLESVIFISKKDIKKMMNYFEKEIELTELDNPFPDTFSIRLKNISIDEVERIQNELKIIKNINEINYDANLLKIISGIKLYFTITENIIFLIFLSLILIIITVVLYSYRLIGKKLFVIINIYTNIIPCVLGLIAAVAVYNKATDILVKTVEQFNRLSLKYILVMLFITVIITIARVLSNNKD